MKEDTEYTNRILRYWGLAQDYHKPSVVTHAYLAENSICGDVVTIEANVQDGKLLELKFKPSGCCFCEAAAMMLQEELSGLSLENIKRYTTFDMLQLFGGNIPINRRECVLLAWKGLMRFINDLLST